MTAPAVARLTSPGDIVAAVPHLCGFVPKESLVVISLRGARRRIGLTMRVDLPRSPAGAAEQVADRVAYDGAVAAALLVYSEQPGDWPHQLLADEVSAALDRRGIEVLEALLVRGGRWSSYTCRRSCCPPAGTPVGGSGAVDALAAAAAYEGRAVLRDREELVASLAAPVLLAARQAEQELAAAQVRRLAEAERRDVEVVRREAVASVRQAMSFRSYETSESAALTVSLQDVHVRDEVATFALDDSESLLALLLALSRQSVAPFDVPVCTLLALVAWVRGDGALANVALDRALAGDPSYAMARLMREGLDGQLPPAAIRQWLRETRRSMRRG